MLFELTQEDVHRLIIAAFDAPGLRDLAERVMAQQATGRKPFTDWERAVSRQAQFGSPKPISAAEILAEIAEGEREIADRLKKGGPHA